MILATHFRKAYVDSIPITPQLSFVDRALNVTAVGMPSTVVP